MSGPDTSGSDPSPSASSTLNPAPPGHICVSTTFYPGAPVLSSDDSTTTQQVTPQSPLADIVLYAVRDQVYFYVHSNRLLEGSINQFAFLLVPPPPVDYSFAMSNAYNLGGGSNPQHHHSHHHDLGSAEPTFNSSSGGGMSGLYQPGAQQTWPMRSQFLQSPPSSDYMLQGSASGESEAGGSHGVVSPSASSPSRPTQVSSPSAPRFIAMDESAEIINLLLHAIYGISAERYYPSFETLSQLPAVLTHYGYAPDAFLGETSPMTRLLLNFTKENLAVEIYALAGAYDLEFVAQRASKACLGSPLTALTDSHIVRMGR